MSDMNDFNAKVIDDFRANKGEVSGQFGGAPMVLVTTTGAKSGKQRTIPLVYLREGDGVYIFASKAGADTNPDWYHNIVANPVVTVELGDERYAATAQEITGAEHDRIYATQAALMPGFQGYAEKTTRVIPVVQLVRSS